MARLRKGLVKRNRWPAAPSG